MTNPPPNDGQTIVFFLDVDNTLLDNDRLKAAIEQGLVDEVGRSAAEKFWVVYEQVRQREDYVDLPATIAQFESEFPQFPAEKVTPIVMDIHFRDFVYPGAFDALSYLGVLGTPVILSDGDPVFQIRKIERSGLAAAVDGRVRLTVHKQKEMDAALAAYPADCHVMIDDKTTILADLGSLYPDVIVTVLVKQGSYSEVPATLAPDISINSIGDIVGLSRDVFLSSAGTGVTHDGR